MSQFATKDDLIEGVKMTDREAFEAWALNNIEGAYSSSSRVIKSVMYDIWIAATKAERERCAKVAEGGSFLHDDAPDAKFGKACAKAIRWVDYEPN